MFLRVVLCSQAAILYSKYQSSRTNKQKDCVTLLIATASKVHVRVPILQQNEASVQSYGGLR